MPNIMVVLPEIYILVMSCFILLVDLALRSKQRSQIIYLLSQLTLLGAGLLSLYLYFWPTTIAFNGTFILDRLSSVLKLAIYITSYLVFWYSKEYVRQRNMPFTEFYVLGLFAILGMQILVSSHHFITLFLGVELSALPTYAMVALWRNSPVGSEAAMKYFVIGSLASGILLYGLSMLYGATGSLLLTHISASSTHDLLLIFALVFILVGIAFKFGAAPFHMWVPDVYTGAPNAVTLFISAAPKLAAMGMAFRLLVDTLSTLLPQWQQVLIVIAISSMALGNFAAIVQTNLKRMLAYSSVSHMGYMLLGLLTGSVDGKAAALFYMFSYGLMALGGFGLLVLLSQNGSEIEQLADLRGLNARNPWLAFMMLLIMFSMAGIPPSIGFFAKLGVLEALINAHFTWLAVLALVFAIIGAYYYINVVKVMYFEEPDQAYSITYTADLRLVISLSGLAVLVLGIFPSTLIMLCRAVV